MASNGLNRSIWANTGSGNGDLFRQPEDWNCPSCGFSNFQWRKDCYQCTSRSSSPAHGTNSRALNGFNTPGISTPPSANGSSGWQNPSTPLRASQASAQMDVESYLQQAVKSGAANLSTSRWAPRNLSGKPRVVSSDNVWIKACLQRFCPLHCLTHVANRYRQQSTQVQAPDREITLLYDSTLMTSASPTKYSTTY
jgi:hypothetical protein